MEHSIKKYSPQAKSGRNSLCQCGSGKKYKKCCLNNETISNNSSTLIQASMTKLKERNSDESIFIDGNKMGAIKMSEVILEYADELLRLASTNKGKENAILFAITAWNISLADKDKRSDMIDSFICDIWNVEKNSEQWKEMHGIFQTLIEIKLYEYPSLNRLILDYEFIQLNSTDFHLNVISSLEYSEMED